MREEASCAGIVGVNLACSYVPSLKLNLRRLIDCIIRASSQVHQQLREKSLSRCSCGCLWKLIVFQRSRRRIQSWFPQGDSPSLKHKVKYVICGAIFFLLTSSTPILGVEVSLEVWMFPRAGTFVWKIVSRTVYFGYKKEGNIILIHSITVFLHPNCTPHPHYIPGTALFWLYYNLFIYNNNRSPVWGFSS